MVDSRRKQRVHGVLCELDIEKAHDHTNWSFLDAIMLQLGFREKWRKWINISSL